MFVLNKLEPNCNLKNIATHVNNEQLIAYWNIGRVIVEHEQDNETRAEYGKATLKQISRQLTKEFGRGFSVSNLQFMRRFYQTYQIQQTLSGTESRMKNGQRSICPWTRAAWKPDKKSELNSWGSSTPKPLDSVRFGVTLAVPQKRAACPKIMRLLSGRK